MIASVKKYNQPIFVISVLLLGLILRLWNLGAESAWIDEAYSIQLARYSLLQIVQGTAADQHPPLYYFLLHFWLILGNTVWNARLFSTLLGVFNLWQVISLGTKIRNIKVGAVAGLLVAAMPLHIYFSQEVRMYMLLLVALTGATSMLWDWLRERKVSQLILYCLLCLFSLYIHNFSAFVLLVHAAFVVVWSILHHERRAFFLWVLSMVVCLVGYLPWLPVAMNQLLYHSMNWMQLPTAATFRDTFLRLVFGFPLPALPGGLTWLMVVAILTMLAAYFVYMRRRKENLNPLILVFLWAFLPFLTISAISLVYPIFQVKQFIVILPALAFIIAIIGDVLPRFFGGILIAGMVLIYLSVSIYQGVTLTKDDWRGMAEYLQGNFMEGDIIFANPSASSLAVSLYAPDLPADSFVGYPPNYHILKGGWEEGGVITVSKAHETLQPYLDHRRIWLVEFSPQLWDPENFLPRELASHYNQTIDMDFTRIHLRLFTAK